MRRFLALEPIKLGATFHDVAAPRATDTAFDACCDPERAAIARTLRPGPWASHWRTRFRTPPMTAPDAAGLARRVDIARIDVVDEDCGVG